MATSIDLAHQLLESAENDDLMARSLLPVEGVADAGIGFHCQQAVEKAIKAVLAARGIEFLFSHDLEYFEDLCERSDVKIPSTLHGVKELTPFAAAERYGSATPLRLDRDQALEWSADAVVWARDIVEDLQAAQEQTTEPAPK
jgi:HEPN domain-containing protein